MVGWSQLQCSQIAQWRTEAGAPQPHQAEVRRLRWIEVVVWGELGGMRSRPRCARPYRERLSCPAATCHPPNHMQPPAGWFLPVSKLPHNKSCAKWIKWSIIGMLRRPALGTLFRVPKSTASATWLGMTNNLGFAMTNTASAPRGARLIARQLQEAITSGAYGYREQLPTERQLAVSYGASRTTIRKALTWLEDQKLVERRAGSGTYASYERQTTDFDIAERTSPLELIEVRAAIEPQMARLAVLHATARDLAKLQGLLSELRGGGAGGRCRALFRRRRAVPPGRCDLHLQSVARVALPADQRHSHARFVGRDAPEDPHCRDNAHLQSTARWGRARHSDPGCRRRGGDHGAPHGEGP